MIVVIRAKKRKISYYAAHEAMASRSLHHPADTMDDDKPRLHVIRNRAHSTNSAEN